jgi:hypothetical protein
MITDTAIKSRSKQTGKQHFDKKQGKRLLQRSETQVGTRITYTLFYEGGLKLTWISPLYNKNIHVKFAKFPLLF